MTEKQLIKCKYFIDSDYFEIIYNASLVEGEDIIQYYKDFDLLGKTSFKKDGYSISSFLNPDDYNSLSNYVFYKIKNVLNSINIPTNNFKLDQYHNFVDNHQHIEVINKIITKRGKKYVGIDIDELPIDVSKIEERVSSLIKYKLTFKGRNVFYIRIVRPDSHDNNPPHRDINLDRLRNLINLYIPIAGSNKKSSLSIAPGSHLLSDKDFYIIKDADIVSSNITSAGYKTKFTVPSNIPKTVLKMIRPNPRLNELLVFTPYLIHGGAVNKSKKTRISLEMRLGLENE